MYKVDIYLAQSTASLSKDERWHGYVVACIKNDIYSAHITRQH